MVVGREGPFVHTSFGLAQMMLTNIPYFAHLNANGTLKRQVFAAACAVGVSSTFTSPIGGVLFSIEVGHSPNALPRSRPLIASCPLCP
mmetsp:Transcript_27308/g.86067  ORF Transcript_27308/g.86067 Transcript_27308/m.86067 type:complete len:88 (-) Transcript_27308:3071-3334(-)